MVFTRHVPPVDDGSPLFGRCIRCISFRPIKKPRGAGVCMGNSQAFKEVFGRSPGPGAPEGPSFEVRRLDGCSHWRAAW